MDVYLVLGGLGGGEALWHTATGPANCGFRHKSKDSLQMQTVWKGPLLISLTLGTPSPIKRSIVEMIIY